MEKPRREEAIMTSKGSGTRRTKEKGDRRGQASDMGWFSAMMRAWSKRTHPCSVISNDDLGRPITVYTRIVWYTADKRTSYLKMQSPDVSSSGRTYATPSEERSDRARGTNPYGSRPHPQQHPALTIPVILSSSCSSQGKSGKHHYAPSNTPSCLLTGGSHASRRRKRLRTSGQIDNTEQDNM